MSKASRPNLNKVDEALSVLFNKAQPSSEFIHRLEQDLERKLEQQARMLTPAQKIKDPRRFPGWLYSVGQTAAWIGAGFLLVTLMAWALTNLLPQPESQGVSPYPTPEVIPTLIVTSPGLPLPPPSETPPPSEEELELPAPEPVSGHRIVFSIPGEIVHPAESGPGAYTFRIEGDGAFWVGSANPSGNRLLKFSEDGELLLDISLEGIEADRFDFALTHTSLWVLVLEPSPARLLRYTRMDLPGYKMEALPEEVITLPPDLQVETGLSGVSYLDRSGVIIELQGGLRRYRYNDIDSAWIVQPGAPAILRPDGAYYQFYDPAEGEVSASPGERKLLIQYSEAGEPRWKAQPPFQDPDHNFNYIRDLAYGYDGRLYMLLTNRAGGFDVIQLNFSGVRSTDEIPHSFPYLNRLAASAYDYYPSPTGEYALEVITAGVPELEIGIHYDRIVLIRPGRLPWVITERLEYPQKGFPFLSHFQWSPDERYMYFFSTAYASPIGTPFDMELHRLEAATGRVEPIPLPDLAGRISISPNASKVVYNSGDGTLHLVDLETFETESAAFDVNSIYWHIDNLAWSPDGNTLVFSVLQDAANWEVVETSAVFLAELEPLRLTKLLDYDERWLTVHSWTGQYPVLKSEREESWYFMDPSTGRLTPAEAINEEDSQAASHWLQFFFSSLWNRNYETSVERYGGSYEILQDWNPELAPDDHAGLLKKGCEVNGLECLPIRQIVEENWVSPSEVRFIVEFLNSDGSRFERGACCGGSPEDFPVETQFSYLVARLEGVWKVMDLPPYMP